MNFCPRCGSRMKLDPYSRNTLVCVNCKERTTTAVSPTRGTARGDGPRPREGPDGDPGSIPMITEEDMRRAPHVKAAMEKEISYYQELYEYAEEKYDEECRKHARECPDNLNLEPELFYKQVYTWFICEKVLDSTGKTVLEEFVERYVAAKDHEAAARMLQSREQIRGSFRVLENAHFPYMIVEALKTGERYVAITKMGRDNAMKLFSRDSVIVGKLHPWGDRYYMFDGILSRRETEEDVARRLGFITPTMMVDIKKRLEEDWVEGAELVWTLAQ